MFMAVIALMMTISASAQFYIYYSDGTVAKVDSISMIAPVETEEPDTPTEPEKPTNPSTGIGVFSVFGSKQVTFSPGNLQYHPANDEWRFAESQLDYIGDANSNCSSTYNGWLDLFGWGTGNNPLNLSQEDNDYRTFVDWGTNKIGNDAPNTWRTLTYEEWYSLLHRRDLCGVAQVNGVNGLILLPDNWTCPSGVSFKSGFHSTHGVEYYADYQTFTAEQWSKMEAAGAVFLPATGERYYGNVRDVQKCGGYWSATGYAGFEDWKMFAAYCLYFSSDNASADINPPYGGQSVRLVKDLQ